MTTASRKTALAYYGALCVLMTLILFSLLGHLLPHPIARHISNDSEGYVLALILPLWIQVARPRLAGSRAQWPVTGLAALSCLLTGVVLYNSSIVSSVRTLNETFFALTLLIPFVQLRRPLPRRLPALISVAVVLLTVVAQHTGLHHLSTQLAEGVVMLTLAPLALDVGDRGILEPTRPTAAPLRRAWWVALALLPLVAIALKHVMTSPSLHAVIEYITRAQEAPVGLLLIHLYFWSCRRSEQPARERTAARAG